MFAHANPAQIPEGGGHADHPVAAHAQVARVVEEDDAGNRRRIDRLDQHGAHQNLRPPRLAQNRAAANDRVDCEKFPGARPEGRKAQMRAARDDTSGGLACGMRIDHFNANWQLWIGHGIVYKIAYVGSILPPNFLPREGELQESWLRLFEQISSSLEWKFRSWLQAARDAGSRLEYT